MATQRENNQANRLTRRREEIRRKYNSLADNLLTEQENYLDRLRSTRSFGGLTSTKQKRAIKEEIARVEQGLEQAKAELDRRELLELQQDGVALPSDVNRAGAASGVRGSSRDVSRDVSQESIDASRDQEMDRREREAGLFLAGNDPLSGRKRLDSLPHTLEERERAAGLFNTTFDTTRGREEFEQEQQQQGQEVAESEEELDTDIDDQFGSIGVILCINGEPFSASILGQVGAKLESAS